MGTPFQHFIEKRWYSRPGVLRLLTPLEWLFSALSRQRRKRQQQLASPFPVPVVVVGNIAVGGTGKTPVIKALCDHFQARGYRPGVVSRGYGRVTRGLLEVSAESTAGQVGDEPLEIYQASGVPVIVAEERCEAVEYLIANHHCDLVFSDDGLQHYRLWRDLEIVVMDGASRLGNGHCLPVGPLREPAARLAEADFVLVNDSGADPLDPLSIDAGQHPFQVQPVGVENLLSGEPQALDSLQQWTECHAVAGIGKPQKFFRLLWQLIPDAVIHQHVFPDHHAYTANDLEFGDQLPLLMTAKDGVKCRPFARPDWWQLTVAAVLPEDFLQQLEARLRDRLKDRLKDQLVAPQR